ncbi:putative F-box protein, partial [Cucurbita argyrosperma subsp. argyrosperma]
MGVDFDSFKSRRTFIRVKSKTPMKRSPVRWSDLPPELCLVIGKRLETYIDVLRFRSVCKSWRASLPGFDGISPLSPLQFPSPANAGRGYLAAGHTLLHRRIIYCFSPLHHHRTSNSSSSRLFTKDKSAKLGTVRFVDLFSNLLVVFDDETFRKDVNFLDFRIYEVAKSYALQYTRGGLVSGITKVIMYPDSGWTDFRTRIIVAVYGRGKLGFAKHGDDNWTLIDDVNFHYNDVIMYKGQVYAVDKWGTVFWIDSSMKSVQFSVPSCGFGDHKHLVECGGELYVVDRFLLKPDPDDCIRNNPNIVTDFKVYMLDQDWGRWVDVKNLGNQAIVLGDGSCFSVSASEIEGFQANCIYFNHKQKGWFSQDCVPAFHPRIKNGQRSAVVGTPAGDMVGSRKTPSQLHRCRPISQRLPIMASPNSSSSNQNGRLVKLEKSELGKMRFLHPLSKRLMRCNPEEHKELNLLDLRIDELAISYSLKYTDTACVPGIAKVVVFPKSTGPDVEDCTVIAVFEDGKLGFARSGDEKWTLIDEQNFHYDDVIVYNRQYYAVDRWGTVFWIDSSMRLVQFSPPLIGLGQQKHLVECGGELLVIDRFLDKERSVQHPTDIMDDAHPMAIPFRRPDNDSSPRAVDFKAHKLDQEWGTWVELKNLGNRSIILGNDCCLSVEASEFEGCKENCIYYTDVNDNEFSKRSFSRVFDLEGGRIGNILCYPGRIGIFSPPPIWLSKSLPPLKDILFAASPHRHEN